MSTPVINLVSFGKAEAVGLSEEEWTSPVEEGRKMVGRRQDSQSDPQERTKRYF